MKTYWNTRYNGGRGIVAIMAKTLPPEYNPNIWRDDVKSRHRDLEYLGTKNGVERYGYR